MRKALLSLACGLLAVSGFAQSRYAYVITDNTHEGVNWAYLRKLDMNTGSFSGILLSGNDVSQLAFDAGTKKQMTVPYSDAYTAQAGNAAFGTGTAAIALDRKHDRLFYTPMLVDQLRYIDLKTMKSYFVNTSVLSGQTIKNADQGNIFTRMVIAADGNGYALTNDGSQLIRFTTGKTITITALGSLVDDPINKSISIHNACTSFGGDMIADDAGNLYIFSARNQVFKVNIETRVTTHLGAVAGVPGSFTSNGAAVTPDNDVILTSATNNGEVYRVNMNSLKATVIPTAENWRGADLASANLYLTGKRLPVTEVLDAPETEATAIRIFPNPVTDHKLSLQFDVKEGKYSVQVTSMLGSSILQSSVYIKTSEQTSQLMLPASAKPGLYLVKIVDENKQQVFSQKFMLN